MMNSYELRSPTGIITAQFAITNDEDRLTVAVYREGQPITDISELGITVDGIDLGRNVTLLNGDAVQVTYDESYETRGVHALARNYYCTITLALLHQPSGQRYEVDARTYDDGFAYRYRLVGEGSRRVNGERSSWAIPIGTTIWYFERNSIWKLRSYAGEWLQAPIEDMTMVSSEGPVQGLPLVVKYPDRRGYTALLEAALCDYSGMRLRAVGDNCFQSDFWEGEAGFEVEGNIVTPWRVVLSSADLNGLVNSDLLTNLNPAPNPEWFSDTSYIKPGRSVFRWWCRGTGTPEEEQEFISYAAQLSFEYTIFDEGWERWDDKWPTVKRLTAYAANLSVGVFLWKRSKEIDNPDDDYRVMHEFMDAVATAGAVGMKIDFIDRDSKDAIDFEIRALQLAAERKLMINFHGISKPTGESRTYPNEISREGIRGLELNKMDEGPIPAFHNAALPFTRFIAGHGDYTPVGFSNPGATTYAHQLATAVVFTSPMQVISEDPKVLLEDPDVKPCLDVLMALPTVWDETIVLDPSSIGELALFARRKGHTWYVAGINGTSQPMALHNIHMSFLDAEKSYQKVVLTDDGERRLVREESVVLGSNEVWNEQMLTHGGIVAVFTKNL